MLAVADDATVQSGVVFVPSSQPGPAHVTAKPLGIVVVSFGRTASAALVHSPSAL